MPDGTTWTVPDGGFYVWLTLPEGSTPRRCCRARSTARVAYVPGTGFYADGLGSRQLRLSYCYPTPERIPEGVRRLAGVMEAELDVHAHVRQRGPAAAVGPGPQAPSPDTP